MLATICPEPIAAKETVVVRRRLYYRENSAAEAIIQGASAGCLKRPDKVRLEL